MKVITCTKKGNFNVHSNDKIESKYDDSPPQQEVPPAVHFQICILEDVMKVQHKPEHSSNKD